MTSDQKQITKWVRRARKLGWIVSVDGRGHRRLVGPDGQQVLLPFSPSDWRSLKNCRRDLRRAGLL